MTASRSSSTAEIDDDGSAEAYRPASALAVAALVAGAASPLALFGGGLWLLAALAVVLALAALWRIHRSRGGLIGGRLAFLGLLVASFSLAAVGSETLVYRRALRDEARRFVEGWIDLVLRDDGRSRFIAHQYALPVRDRSPLDEHLPALYGPHGPGRALYEGFLASRSMRFLRELRPPIGLEFGDIGAPEAIKGGIYVDLRVRIVPSASAIDAPRPSTAAPAAPPAAREMLFQLLREEEGDGQATWRVISLSLPDETSPAG